MGGSIDFSGIAARALSQAETLVPMWLPAGRRRSHEWVVGDLQGAEGESTSINLTTGQWADFSGTQKGGDLISLYAAINGLTQAEAAKQLEPDVDAPAPRANGHRKPPAEFPAVSAPLDFPELPSWNGLRPCGQWPYFGNDTAGPLFIVCRYDPPDASKEIRPYTWRNAKWSAKHYPEPRPLYRLRGIIQAPQLPVLIVEGEKSADAAAIALAGSYSVTTWSGGANAHGKTDFSVLAGHNVTIWPDADDPGRLAAAAIAGKLGPVVSALRVIAVPEGTPTGWDAADAIADGMNLEQFIAQHSRAVTGKPAPEPTRITRAQPQRATGDTIQPDGAVDESAFSQWEAMDLARAGGGTPFATVDNVERILSRHPKFAGRLHLDTFRLRKIITESDGSEREWTDADTLALLVFIQRHLYMPKMKLGEVRSGVQAAAGATRRNSLTDWLTTLEWDGIERLPSFMVDVFHADCSQYAADVGRCWLVSMVARAFNPGCQVDTMVVLEGGQGTYKSSALGILGGPYYAALPAAFGTRDFLQALDGMWLIEIPDMSGFRGRDIEHVKAIITTRQDRYRRAYGHDAETYPRQCVFAATSNGDDWNEDSTGARRFLPVKVTGEVALGLLKSIRAQLFAEAVHRYRSGEKWWDLPADETRTQQAERRPEDSWQPAIQRALESIRVKSPPDRKHFVTLAQVFEELSFDLPKQGKAEQMRIGKILRALGWERKTAYVHGAVEKQWHSPKIAPEVVRQQVLDSYVF